MTKDVWAMGQIQMARAMLEAKKRILALEEEIESSRALFGQVFDLLITARNSKDGEALQDAIDIAATASITAEKR